MKTFILIRGIPGSGKSTIAQILRDHYKVTTNDVAGPYEADQWQTTTGERDGSAYQFNPKVMGYCHGECFKACKKAFEAGVKVVIQSNTNTVRKEYSKYVDEAEKHGYKVQEIIVKADFGNVHGVPEATLTKMRERFQY
jgi:adenylate kinase family enzyme